MFEITVSSDILDARIEVMQAFEFFSKNDDNIPEIVDQLCARSYGFNQQYQLSDLFDNSNQLAVFLSIPAEYAVLK